MSNVLSYVWLFVTPRTVDHQAPLFMGFSRQEYWSGLPCPPPEDLPNLKPGLPHCKEFQPVHSKGDQPRVFFGRTDAKAETPVLWPPHVESWLIGKDSDAGKDSGQEEKGMTEDEMAGWHHRLDGPEFEWTPGVGDRQEGLVCCNSCGRKESDTTERLNWTDTLKIK